MKGGEAILEQKLAALRDAVGRLRRVAVAFSGGVDSTFLLRVAHDVLGDDAIVVTARLSTVPDRELGILSPLRDASLGKTEIRLLSAEMGLPTASKPSFACLATRFPYGECLTPEAVERVGRAELFLFDLGAGLSQVRVRVHGPVARIEVPSEDIPVVVEHRDEIVAALRKLGFTYVSLDLAGYHTGSMNAMLV